MVKTLEKESVVTWESVLGNLAARREEFHRQGYVSRDMIDQFKALGIYRAAAPQRFGGEPLSPGEYLKIVERVAAVDGSAGWVIAFGSALTYLGALPLETQAEIYKDGPDIVFAGGLYPMQEAKRTATGFNVSGQWKFASGCMGADWIGVGLLDSSAGGKPRVAVLPAAEVEIVQDWDVNGMRATGSFDTVLRNAEVPFERTFVRGGPSLIDEPLFRYPTVGYQAQVHAAVGLGVAQAAIDYAHGAGSYTGITAAPPLAARPYFRSHFAKTFVAFQSARSYFYEITEQVWATILAGDTVSETQMATIRLAAAHAADVSSQTVHDVAAVSGSKIIQNGHPMNLLRLDAHVPQLHALLGQGIYDAAGAVLMQQPTSMPGFP